MKQNLAVKFSQHICLSQAKKTLYWGKMFYCETVIKHL